MAYIFKTESEKEPEEILDNLKEKAADYNFIIREIYDMKKQFISHGVSVDEDFTYYSVMLCNPEKAYKSILSSKIRGAVLLPPKQLVIFKDENENTQIAYMAFDSETVKRLLPDDEAFQKGLSGSCEKIIEFIKDVK
jgi:hypothetical protein